MRKRFLFLIGFFFIFIFLNSVFATLNVSLSDQGTDVKDKSTGNVLTSGDLSITIYDALSGGNLIYNETFVGAIVNGAWNVMLGENSSNSLSLEFGKIYYKDYAIDGSDLDFTDYQGNTVERQFFYSPLGDIAGEDISANADLEIASLNVTNTGLFDYLGSLANKIIKLFVTDIDAVNIETSGNIDVGGDLNVTGTIYGDASVLNVNNSDFLDGYNSSFFMPLNTSVYGNFNFDGGWMNNGLSIIGGDIFAQTGYFYNITSLNVTEQNLTIVNDLIVYGNTELKQNLTVNIDTLFVDSDLNRVGIGTTSPDGTLEVIGNAIIGAEGTGLVISSDGYLSDEDDDVHISDILDMDNNAIIDINWAGSDDGSGSLLDADKLDGSEKTAFQMDVVDSCSGENVIQTISQAGVVGCYNTYSAADDLIDDITEWQTACIGCVTETDIAQTSSLDNTEIADIYLFNTGDYLTEGNLYLGSGTTYSVQSDGDGDFRYVGIGANPSSTYPLYVVGNAYLTATTYLGLTSTYFDTSGNLVCTDCIGDSDVSNTLTASYATNAGTLDSIDSLSFLRSDATDYFTGAALYTRGDIVVETAYRDHGVFGTYDSTKTQHIWSMGTGYRNAADGTSFGNLYGLAYKYNGDAGGHGVYLVQNGAASVGLGTNLWTSGAITGATINTGYGAKEIGDSVGNCLSTDVHKGDGGCEAESALSVGWADTVDVNPSDSGGGEYEIVWASGDTVYSTTGISINRDGKRITTPVIAAGIGTALLPSHTFSADLNTGMWSSADNLKFSTGGVQRVMMYSSWPIYVSGKAYVSDYLRADGGLTTDATDPGTNRLRVGDYAMILGGAHIGGTSDPGTDNLIVDGNVGIGTTGPLSDLSVNGVGSYDYATYTQAPVGRTNAYGLVSLANSGSSRNYGILASIDSSPGNPILGAHSAALVATYDQQSWAYLGAANTAIKSSVTRDTNSPTYGLFIYTDNDYNSAAHHEYGIWSEVRGLYGNNYGVYSRPLGTGVNYAYYGEVANGNPDWGVYITGEDKNYFSGDVGIGTTTPDSTLDVHGDVNVTGDITGGVSKNFATATSYISKQGIAGWVYDTYRSCPTGYPNLISCTMDYHQWQNRGGYSETYASGCDISGNTCRAKSYMSVTYNVITQCRLLCAK